MCGYFGARAVLLLKEFWQGSDQGKGFFTRAFALACPGVAPPLDEWSLHVCNYFVNF